VRRGCGEAGPRGSGRFVYAWADALLGGEGKFMGSGRDGFELSKLSASERIGTAWWTFDWAIWGGADT